MCLESLKKNPYYLFWLGVLIGALVTGLLFSYKIYWTQSETSIFKSGSTYKIQQQKQKESIVKPKKQSAPKGTKNAGDPNPWNAKKGGTNAGDPNPW
ncbi:MAG: hypothetical protein AAB739_04385 [Patescibacteria group bacterium]